MQSLMSGFGGGGLVKPGGDVLVAVQLSIYV